MQDNTELSLSDIIAETLAVEDPVADNPEAEVTEEDNDEFSVDDLLGSLEEDEDEEEDEDTTDEPQGSGETYQVKVNGEVIEVTLDEALAGYQRQADYTRKAQALSQEREAFQEEIQQYQETFATLEQLDQAWEDNPVTVIANFTLNTENPTHAVALLIKELASQGALERDFLETFGITPDVQRAWAKEGEVENLRRKVDKTERSEAENRERQQHEAQVQQALAQYEQDVDDILASEGLTDITVAQRDNFKRRLASYAYENELTNLKAAYKALKYEESQKKAKVAQRTKERAKQKKNAGAVGRSGAGSAGAAPVTDSNDLQAIIKAAMDEAASR
jgi:hypothetical protein